MHLHLPTFCFPDLSQIIGRIDLRIIEIVGHRQKQSGFWNFCLIKLGILLLAASSLVAQPAIEWDKSYGPVPDFIPSIVCATDDGGIIVGRSLSYISFSDYNVAKYDIDGNKEWDKTFSGNKQDILKAIIQTTDGGYLLGGSSNSNDGQDKTNNAYSSSIDYWVIKISANGTKQWDKTYGGKNEDALNSLRQTKDGGYILGGTSLSSNDGMKSEARRGDYDYWVIKVASDGTKEWDKTIGGRGRDALVYVDQTASGNYILGGTSSSMKSGDKTDAKGYSDYWIVQLAPDGAKLWDKTYGGPNDETLQSMDRTSDGGYILGGISNSNAGMSKTEPRNGFNDFWVVKINANGEKEWDRTLGGEMVEVLKSVKQTPDGGYIVGGNSPSNASGNKTEAKKGLNDYWIVKLNPAGTIVWDKTVGGAKETNSQLIAAFPAWDGGYLLCGTAAGIIAGNDRIEALSNETELWVVKLVSETNTKALAFSSRLLKFTNDGNITTPEQSVNLSANTGTPAVKLRKSQADWLTIPAPSRGSLPFTVDPAGLLPAKYTSYVAATSPGYARAILNVNLHVNDVTTPPVLNPIPYQELKAGDTLTFTARATMAIGQTKRFSLIGAPKGATIGKSSGVFSWVPQSSGIYKFVVRISVAAVPELYDEETVTVKVVNSGGVNSVRINAGGSAYTASDGRVFEADNYYDGVDRTSTIADVDILNTTDDELYRSGRSSDYFNYNIPVTNGIVKVTLHFAEVYWGVYANRPAEINRRLFNVSAEGAVKLNNYSIIGRAGRALRAVQETFEVEVMDGVLNLAFRSTSERRDKPRVSAIEVEFLGSMSTATLSPVADADVSYGINANTNYGNEPTLSVKATSVPELQRVSFLKFSLANFSDITSARFRIYGYNHQANTRVSLNVAGLDNDDWTETGITASNAPTGVTTALGTLSVTRKPEYFEVGITEFAKTQLARDKTLTLRIDQTFGGKRIIFNSRENAQFRPELVINTSEPVSSVTRLAAEEVDNNTAESGAESSVIYPNPVRTQFTLQVGNQHQEAVALQLFNEAGRAYNIKMHELLHAGTKAEISIADLSLNEGIYLLKVQSVSKSEVLKVVVVK
ncbi:DNRLRE domain-containing protein [Dyadobacter flavalbus]|uniref:DNRLRE domain-containing protein n=1 Tax=Dyadobacter flavalbus TaxID=2579942 RepID=A0A5M8QTN3_9BACT|nr:malectin domain-containing carbohydrate-binding protein [Dyadobacter flavalbus]KAA6438410.1 DNRLRE domain-containing protein [Dyadobacter flavalbus]